MLLFDFNLHDFMAFKTFWNIFNIKDNSSPFFHMPGFEKPKTFILHNLVSFKS